MKAGDHVQWWAGKEHGWVSAEILSVSVNGVPTVIDPITGKKRQLRGRKRWP